MSTSPSFRAPVFPCGPDAMTLAEWVGRLPREHPARFEYEGMRQRIEALEGEIFLRTKEDNIFSFLAARTENPPHNVAGDSHGRMLPHDQKEK